MQGLHGTQIQGQKGDPEAKGGHQNFPGILHFLMRAQEGEEVTLCLNLEPKKEGLGAKEGKAPGIPENVRYILCKST